jgi:hypothetical protein
LRLDIAGNLAAALDLDLAVANRSGDPSAGLDQEPLADHQIAFEPALDLGFLDRGRALEEPALGDLDIAAIVEVGLDAAFDDQLVTGGDLARKGGRIVLPARARSGARGGIVGTFAGPLGPGPAPGPTGRSGFIGMPRSSDVSAILRSSVSVLFLLNMDWAPDRHC